MEDKKHKARRRIVIILIVVLCFVAAAAVWFLSGYQHTSSERPEEQYTGTIEQFHSSVDKDSDGTDDQTDILEGALAYVDTHPKYKSKYYNSGYPDDGYGVCTDVIANAMKAAGYDLMELVSEDIAAHPDDYDIEEPDKNIDFRRVKNLQVYFRNNAVSLTTDVHDIQEWQDGDIVIFKNHIGVVSDRRNKDSVPYVIHHNDPQQKNYEQDIMETRNDIVGTNLAVKHYMEHGKCASRPISGTIVSSTALSILLPSVIKSEWRKKRSFSALGLISAIILVFLIAYLGVYWYWIIGGII